MALQPYASNAAGAAHGALVPIVRVTADGTSGQYNLTGIPQGYQDLMLVINGRINYTGTTILNGALGFNANVAGIMGATRFTGIGSGAVTSSRVAGYGFSTAGFFSTIAASPNMYGTSIINVFNYANTSMNKTYLSRSACDINGSGQVDQIVGSWNSTAAITQVNINSSYDTWAVGSTFTLYGVRSIKQ
jgi:hypothetical protein